MQFLPAPSGMLSMGETCTLKAALGSTTGKKPTETDKTAVLLSGSALSAHSCTDNVRSLNERACDYVHFMSFSGELC